METVLTRLGNLTDEKYIMFCIQYTMTRHTYMLLPCTSTVFVLLHHSLRDVMKQLP